MTTLAMNRLLAFIESLDLSTGNRRWLAEKLIEPTKDTVSTNPDQSLRNAFSGDWCNDLDSTSYAQILRDESTLENREVEAW